MATDTTFVFAPEIESKFITVLWHEPARISLALAQLDPQVHITQPALRHILEAIRIAYGECGDADWALVISVLAEQNRLDDCGGLIGLNAIWAADDYVPTPDAIFSEYIRLLQEYAQGRPDQEPAKPLTGGKATLEPNKNKRSPNDCDYLGYLRLAGRKYTVRAWMALDGSFINFLFYPM